MAEEAVPAPVVATAPAAPVIDAQTMQILKALTQQQQQPAAPPVDPFEGVAAQASTETEAPVYSGGKFMSSQALPTQARDIRASEPLKIKPTILEGPSMPELRPPTIADILKKYNLTLDPAMQQAKAKMIEALHKIKSTAASPITPKIK